MRITYGIRFACGKRHPAFELPGVVKAVLSGVGLKMEDGDPGEFAARKVRMAVPTADEVLRFIDELNNEAILMLDDAGIITWSNKGAEQINRWSAEELLGRHWSIFYPAAAIAEGRPDHILEIARMQGRYAGEELRLRKDSTEYLAHVVVYVLRDSAGNITGYGKVVRDITEWHRVQSAVQTQEVHLRSILDTVPDAMVVIDERGAIHSFSAAAERLFGYSERDVIGRNVSLLAPSPHHEAHDSYLARYLATGERRIIGIGRVVAGKKCNGSIFPMELSIGEVVTDDGHRLFTGFIRDLSTRQDIERRMQDLQEELIHVSRVSAVGTMASTLAHELNQPLTAVANYVMAAQAMLEIDQPEAQAEARQALADGVAEAVRAGQIVRRLRDFVARGETDREIVSLTKLIEEAAALALAGASERRIRVEMNLDPTVSGVLVDRVQIQQVLLNLIRNAVEAMDDCERRELTLATVARSNEEVELSVADTGPGLADHIAERLFEPFVSTKAHGLGVGLSICRTIVDAHDGRLWAEARPGGGTIFRFTLTRLDRQEDQND